MTDTAPQVPIESFQEPTPPKKSSFVKNTMIGILALVILSEVGYLTYNNFFKPKDSSISGPSISLGEVTPQVDEISLGNQDTDPESKEDKNGEDSINSLKIEKTSRLFQYLNNGADYYQEAYLTISNQGIFKEIIPYKEVNVFGEKYSHKIHLDVGESRDYQHEFTPKQLISTRIVNTDNTSYTNITDVPPGTRIRITSRYYLKSGGEIDDRVIIIILSNN